MNELVWFDNLTFIMDRLKSEEKEVEVSNKHVKITVRDKDNSIVSDDMSFISDTIKEYKGHNLYLNLWRFGQEYRGRVSFSYKGFWERLRERNHKSNGSMP